MNCYLMIRIRVFSDFCDSTYSKIEFEKTNVANHVSNYGITNKYYITDKNDYTHAILLNKAMPELSIPKSNVIGFACEPREFLYVTNEFVEYAKKYVGKYFIGNGAGLPFPFQEGFGYLWHVNPGKEIVQKTKCMSIIVSLKTYAPGHQYRHDFVSKIIELRLPIDIYGRGTDQYSYPRIMGKFAEREPYEDYMFTIAIENFQNNHYVSEKVMTPLMFNCRPIYWGCPNINDYFEGIIGLSGELTRDIELVSSILKNPAEHYCRTYTDKNIKNANLLENLDTLFSV